MASSITSALGSTGDLGRDQFMQLLVTQMQNQNPLDPMKDSDFISQLAQFSSLEGMQNLNTSFDQMLSLQQFTQGANLIGKQVQFKADDSSSLSSGVVDGVTVRDGAINLIVGGQQVPLTSVVTMQAAP